MSRRSKAPDLDIAFRKIMISSQIVSSKRIKGGKDYQLYAGASLTTALKLARLHSLLKAGLIPKKYMIYMKIYAIYLDQMRKAEFSSVGTDTLSKLGFILGDPRETTRVKFGRRDKDKKDESEQ